MTLSETWSVPLGDETIRARHWGPAHTGGDVAVHFEQANVVHLGDLLNNRGYPNVDAPAGASVHGWIRVPENMAPADPADALSVYGHAEAGHPFIGTRPDLRYQRDDFTAIIETARRARREGQGVRALVDLTFVGRAAPIRARMGRGPRCDRETKPMHGHFGWLAASVPLVAVALGGSASLGAQPPAKAGTSRPWTVPRTPDGRPDLQGIWTNATLTPLERPRAMAGRAFLTVNEATALEAQASGRQTAADEPAARAQALTGGDVGSYNQFWFDSGSTILPTRQTSLVVDPPDGRVPVRPEAEARRDEALKRSTEHPEFMSMWDRCISRGVPGWIIPAGYNNAYQIVQTPGYVVIHAEMIHDARIVPMDGRPPLPSTLRLLEGESRGRWDGDTLVVETTNFSDQNWIATSAASGRIKGIPQSTALKIVERFTRTAPDRIDYDARIEDPATFTQPWSLAFPLTKDDEYRIYEYACHEGNRAIEGVLRGARYQERTPDGPKR